MRGPGGEADYETRASGCCQEDFFFLAQEFGLYPAASGHFWRETVIMLCVC